MRAGCDLLITSDYETQYAEVLAAVQIGELAESAARMDVPVKFVTSCMR